MTCPVLLGCRVDHTAPRRPGSTVITHERIIGHFVRDDSAEIDVVVLVMENRETGTVGDPAVFLWRRDGRLDFEVPLDQARHLAAILGGLDPDRLLAFASALAKATDVARNWEPR